MASAQRPAPGVLDDAETRVTTAPRIADQVHAILRGQIISGELLPNQRLTERGLSATLGVSPTPVREAISQLEYERLLVRVDGRLFVAAPDARRLRELSLVQAALMQLDMEGMLVVIAFCTNGAQAPFEFGTRPHIICKEGLVHRNISMPSSATCHPACSATARSGESATNNGLVLLM